jgi:hypothetical protein
MTALSLVVRRGVVIPRLPCRGVVVLLLTRAFRSLRGIGGTQRKLRYDPIKSTLSDANDPSASFIFAGNVRSNHVATRKILKNGWNRERSVAPRTPNRGIEFVSNNGRGTKKSAVLLVGRVAKLQAVGSYRNFTCVPPFSGLQRRVLPVGKIKAAQGHV